MYIQSTAGRQPGMQIHDEIERDRERAEQIKNVITRHMRQIHIFTYSVNWVLIRIQQAEKYILLCPFIYSLPVTS